MRPARARARARLGPLLASALLHAVAISSAWWAMGPGDTLPELEFTSIAVSVPSSASEGEARPPEEEISPPEPPDLLPTPEQDPDPPDVAPEVPEQDELEPLEVERPGPVLDGLPSVPVDARTRPRRAPAPTPPIRPAPPRPAPTVASLASVGSARVEGAVPFGTNRPPVYPPEAVLRGWRGLVGLRLLVDETGAVRDASVRSSSGHAVLDDAALLAARGWRYAPARRGGRPIPIYVNATIHFD